MHNGWRLAPAPHHPETGPKPKGGYGVVAPQVWGRLLPSSRAEVVSTAADVPSVSTQRLRTAQSLANPCNLYWIAPKAVGNLGLRDRGGMHPVTRSGHRHDACCHLGKKRDYR